MAEEVEPKSPDARAAEILGGLLRQILIDDWTQNRVNPTVIKPSEDYKFAQHLVPKLGLTRQEFDQIVLPVLQGAANVTKLCRDTLPIGVQIIRRTAMRDPDSKHILSSTVTTMSKGTYSGKPAKDSFGWEKEDDDEEDKEAS